MHGERFRLNGPTIAVRTQGGKRITITLREGAIITVVREIEGSYLAEIEWRGELLEMLTSHLRERGQPL